VPQFAEVQFAAAFFFVFALMQSTEQTTRMAAAFYTLSLSGIIEIPLLLTH